MLVTPEQKEEFLNLFSSGMKRNEAAETVGSTGSKFRKISNPKSRHYDPEFAARFNEAKTEHDLNFEERVRSEFVGRAFGGSDRLLDLLGRVTMPEMQVLQTQRVEINGRVLVGRYFDLTQLDTGEIVSCPHCGGYLPEIDTLTALVQKAQKKELPSGNGG